jgi:ribosomal protein L20A (L18A)
MRIWEVKGYISSKVAPQTRFTTQVHALDRSSAVRLTQGQYGSNAAQYIQISSIRDMGPSKLTAS